MEMLGFASCAFPKIEFFPTTFMLWVTFSPAPECVEAWCWNFKIRPRRGPRNSVVVVVVIVVVVLYRG